MIYLRSDSEDCLRKDLGVEKGLDFIHFLFELIAKISPTNEAKYDAQFKHMFESKPKIRKNQKPEKLA